VLITGASSGIGRSCAIEASSLGAHCVLSGRNEKQLNETANLCKTPAEIIPADLLKSEDIKKIADKIAALDGFVSCAGIINPRPIKFLRQENLQEIFSINYFAPVTLTAELLQAKKMNDGASFVFISSVSSKHPYFGGAAYVSSKAALEAFSRTLALETAPKKMRSNVLLPGLVETQMLKETREAVGEEEFQAYEKQYPLGYGKPEDVANAVCFLLSDESRWITGSELKLDGGLVLSSKK
jgi:NAD(P)-dependent dehydrogenase (short-subunit alcohol dehydrogenase family)